MSESEQCYVLWVSPMKNQSDGKQVTRSKFSEEKICQLVEKMIKMLIEKEGSWVILDESYGEANQKEVFNRVRETLKIMNIPYSIPDPSQTRYLLGDPIYKIKVMSEEQLKIWKEGRKQNGTFSERNGYRDPQWINDYRYKV